MPYTMYRPLAMERRTAAKVLLNERIVDAVKVAILQGLRDEEIIDVLVRRISFETRINTTT